MGKMRTTFSLLVLITVPAVSSVAAEDVSATGAVTSPAQPAAPVSRSEPLIDPFAEGADPADKSEPVPPAAPVSAPVVDEAPRGAVQEQPGILSAPAAAAKPRAHTNLYFRNDAGDAFHLVEARFVMDGKELPVVINNAQRGKAHVIYSGPIEPGRHIVTARLVYQGRSRGGVFNYMKGYKLNVQSDGVFTTPSDRSLSFTIVSGEKKGINIPIEKRVAVTVEEHRATTAAAAR
jgi:hypothetical protein